MVLVDIESDVMRTRRLTDFAHMTDNQRIDALERHAMAEEERRLTDAERDARRAQWLRQNPDTPEALAVHNW